MAILQAAAPAASILAAADMIVTLLEAKIAEAKAGVLVGVGVVSLSADGAINVDTRGANPAALVVGAAQLQRQILEQVFGTKALAGGKPQ